MKHFYIMAIVGAIALYSNLKYTFAEPAAYVKSSVYSQTSADYAYDKALSNFIAIKEGREPSSSKKNKTTTDPCDTSLFLFLDTNGKKWNELKAKHKKLGCEKRGGKNNE